MTTQTTTSVNLLEMFAQDPVFGCVDRYLLRGGSWYEADQMYWRILQKRAVEGIQELTAAKHTKSNQEKAEAFLKHLKESSSQLFPTQDSMAVFQRADSVVKTWAPPAKTPAAPKAAGAGKSTGNSFALLGADSEDEE